MTPLPSPSETRGTRLSPRMQEAVQLLRDGWELGMGSGSAWFQRRLMCGGKSIDISAATVQALVRRGVIREKRRRSDPYWLTRFALIDPKPSSTNDVRAPSETRGQGAAT